MSELPVGSRPDEIFAFLQAEGLDDDRNILYASSYSFLQDLYDVPESSRIIITLTRDTGMWQFPQESTYIVFVLDENDRLERHIFDRELEAL